MAVLHLLVVNRHFNVVELIFTAIYQRHLVTNENLIAAMLILTALVMVFMFFLFRKKQF